MTMHVHLFLSLLVSDDITYTLLNHLKSVKKLAVLSFTGRDPSSSGLACNMVPQVFVRPNIFGSRYQLYASAIEHFLKSI